MEVIFWIVIALIAVAAMVSGKSRTGGGGRPTRIDHPHYFDEDDHECSVCGARFRGKGMTCPKCGTRFEKTKEDDLEFIEEMEIWDGDD